MAALCLLLFKQELSGLIIYMKLKGLLSGRIGLNQDHIRFWIRVFTDATKYAFLQAGAVVMLTSYKAIRVFSDHSVFNWI